MDILLILMENGINIMILVKIELIYRHHKHMVVTNACDMHVVAVDNDDALARVNRYCSLYNLTVVSLKVMGEVELQLGTVTHFTYKD